MDKILLREKYKKLRASLSDNEKKNIDNLIFERLIKSDEYINSNLILIYVSINDEISTEKIICHALANNKKVAVPYCNNFIMQFYEIKSFDELSEVQFGIPTINITNRDCVKLTDNTLCIVPALAVDLNGNRLGYGGGYYDRFLSVHSVQSAVLCREFAITDKLPSENHDIKIKKIITESKIIEFN